METIVSIEMIFERQAAYLPCCFSQELVNANTSTHTYMQ